MSAEPPIARELWDTLSPDAQAAVLGAGPILRAADRRPGGAARQELHQLLQAPVRRSPLGQATAARPPPRARSGAGSPAIVVTPRAGPARATPAGHRVQAAGLPLVRPRPARRRPRADPPPGRRGAAESGRRGRIPAPSPGVPPVPHLDLCGPAAGRPRRGVRPPAAGHPQRPGRGLPPGQATDPPTGLRPARPVDLHGDDLPAGAAGRRRVGGPGRGTPGVRPCGRRRPTSTRPSWKQGRDRRGSGWP